MGSGVVLGWSWGGLGVVLGWFWGGFGMVFLWIFKEFLLTPQPLNPSTPQPSTFQPLNPSIRFGGPGWFWDGLGVVLGWFWGGFGIVFFLILKDLRKLSFFNPCESC